MAAPYPGTELYRQAADNGWLPSGDEEATLVSESGTQIAALSYPRLSQTEILESVDMLYKRFYFRAGKLAEMSAEMLRHPETAGRRLREGGQFVRFLRRPRADDAHLKSAGPVRASGSRTAHHGLQATGFQGSGSDFGVSKTT